MFHLFVCFFPPMVEMEPSKPLSFPGLVIGGDALGPALQKLLGEESQCVAAGTDRAVVKMDPPETSLDVLKQKHMDFFPRDVFFSHGQLDRHVDGLAVFQE